MPSRPRKLVFGPTYAEMKDPAAAPAEARDRDRSPGLFDVSWRVGDRIPHTVIPDRLSGVWAPIVVLAGRSFPTGSLKAGPAYASLVEKQVEGECAPGEQTVVFPAPGNHGLAGAWAGPLMGYRTLVAEVEGAGPERAERIRALGAEVVDLPGCGSTFREIQNAVDELRSGAATRVLCPFDEFANYRFHFHCTGHAAVELVQSLGYRAGAFVAGIGSAGTIGAGEFVKRAYPGCATVAAEPVQCPTLYDVGVGDHRLAGLAERHVSWIHNVWSTDLLVGVDDQECLEGLQLLQEGTDTLISEGVEEELAASWVGFFGPSGVCNVLAAIKAARYYGLGPKDAVVTVAPDGFDRYPAVLRRLNQEQGGLPGRDEARRRLSIFRGQKSDAILEATREVRRLWHNQKYFTWVEQRGKGLRDLQAQEDADFWLAHQERAGVIDRTIRQLRGF